MDAIDQLKEWLEKRLRQSFKLSADQELTGEWRRNYLDEFDRQATEVNAGHVYGGHLRTRKKVVTHKDAEAEDAELAALEI